MALAYAWLLRAARTSSSAAATMRAQRILYQPVHEGPQPGEETRPRGRFILDRLARSLRQGKRAQYQ
eukprot:scaffold207348_cov33-Tisochrysis_lutea.AAC.1